MAARSTSVGTGQALDLMASLVLENGERWGAAATEWQWGDATAVLNPHSRTPYHFLTRPRGGSKTADLAGMAIGVMLFQAPPGARLYGLAADRDQGRLLIDSVQGYADRTPGLADLIEITSFRITVPASGVTFEVLAADAASAFGLRPYFLVIDELAQWAQTTETKRLFEAVRTAAGKLNGRLAIISTAGDPTHFAYEVLEHARKDPLWRVNEVQGPVPWLSAVRLEEQRRALTESSFRRLHLNEWVEAEDRLTTLEDLTACATLDGYLEPHREHEYVIGVDIGIKHDRSVAAVCHAIWDHEISGWKVVVDQIDVWEASRGKPVQLGAVKEALLVNSRRFHDAKVVIDPYQAVGLAQSLRGLGVRIEEFTFSQSSVGQLAGTLHMLLRNRAIQLPNDSGLIQELARVRLRESVPGVLRLDHDANEHDDRAIAIALAAVELLERPPGSGPRLYVLTGPSPPARFGNRFGSRAGFRSRW